jgi:phospholipase C
VPTWVISPHARRRHLEPTLYEHSSTLKFLERVFDLPTLASINHPFDDHTPAANNNAAVMGVGTAARPRDALQVIGDLTECFDF